MGAAQGMWNGQKVYPDPRFDTRNAAEHGTASRYAHGCRCDQCRYAAQVKQREYRQRTMLREGAMHRAYKKRPEDWKDDAQCVGQPVDVFFPERGESTAEAKKLCAGCPVTQQCLEYSLSTVPVMPGVWGGLSDQERRKLKRTRRDA